MPDPEVDFRDCPGQMVDPPWDPFWSCANFASDGCSGDCVHCVILEAYPGEFS